MSFKIVCLSYNPLKYFYQSQTLKSSTRRTYDEPLSILYKLLHRAPRCIHILASYCRHSRFSSLAWYMDHLKQLTLVFAVIIGLRERRKWWIRRREIRLNFRIDFNLGLIIIGFISIRGWVDFLGWINFKWICHVIL